MLYALMFWVFSMKEEPKSTVEKDSPKNTFHLHKNRIPTTFKWTTEHRNVEMLDVNKAFMLQKDEELKTIKSKAAKCWYLIFAASNKWDKTRAGHNT
eukprot:9769360-Ditylum_brightwellii.AAC.1